MKGSRCLNIVYADSISASLRLDSSSPRSPNSSTRSGAALSRLAELPCDIVVSTHPSATRLDEKIKKRAAQKGGPDPFVDQGCKALAATAMKGLEARIAEEKK